MDNELQRRRDENLERNRLFFENLLGKSEFTVVNDTPEKDVAIFSTNQTMLSDFTDAFAIDLEKQLFLALQYYPERRKQVTRLFSYLRSVSVQFTLQTLFYFVLLPGSQVFSCSYLLWRK
jgi:hypothetical protein